MSCEHCNDGSLGVGCLSTSIPVGSCSHFDLIKRSSENQRRNALTNNKTLFDVLLAPDNGLERIEQWNVSHKKENKVCRKIATKTGKQKRFKLLTCYEQFAI